MITLKNKNILFWAGIICLSAWVIDFINILFFVHRPAWLLWESSAGLGLTGIALIFKNKPLVAALFCAMFIPELIWGIGFISIMVFRHIIPGVAEYIVQPGYSKKDTIITMYHLLIPPSLLLGVTKLKPLGKHSWLGATLFSTILVTLTYFLDDIHDNVNCVHTITYCRTFVPFLYSLTNPLRIIVGIILVSIAVYLPLNYLALYWQNLLLKKTSSPKLSQNWHLSK